MNQGLVSGGLLLRANLVRSDLVHGITPNPNIYGHASQKTLLVSLLGKEVRGQKFCRTQAVLRLLGALGIPTI